MIRRTPKSTRVRSSAASDVYKRQLYNNARLLGNFDLADWNFLSVGAEYLTESLTAPRNNIEDKSNTEYIVFAQEDFQITPELNLISGFRANHNSQYNWHFTPQVSAMYR